MPTMTQAEKAGYDTHVASTANPHSTTAAQVGAVSTSKLTSNLLLLSTNFSTGTSEPASLADSLFTGKSAGGLAGPGTGGTVGVIAGSFSSSGAETGTGSGQGGLGSSPSATQPYNSTDFPGGQFFGDLFKNGSPVLLLDMLSTAGASFPASVDSPVIVFFSFRSDLGADLKWRAWYYFVDQATGNLTSFTPTTNVTGCYLRAPQVVTIANEPTALGLQEAPAVPAAADIEFGGSANVANVGTSAAAGTRGEAARIDHVHAHGDQTVDTLHADATNSADGFMPKADRRFFGGAGLYRDIINDDFDTGGAYTTGAAAVPTTVNFGTAQWRCGLTGTGAAITYVVTNADTTHSGIVELNTGTTTTGAAGGIRAASGALAARFFGSGQVWEQNLLIRIPTLSTAGEEYILRFGWNSSHTVQGTDGVYFEYDRLTSTNWRGVARAASSNTVASGGSNVAVSAAAWIHLQILWDGTTLTFKVDGTTIGTITTGIPTAGVAEDFHIVKSAGTTARTCLVDKYHHDLAYTSPRAA